MGKRILALVAVFLVLGYVAWAGGMTWTGVVSDDHCKLNHSTASSDAAECVEKCVAGGGKYVLVSEGKLYQVLPQTKFKGLGGKSVKVTGKLKGDVIHAENVTAAE